MRKLYIIKIVACILFVLLVISIIALILVETKLNSDELPYKEPYQTNIEYDIYRPQNISYETLKNDIDKLFNNPSYELKFTEMHGNIYGQCSIFDRQIKLRKNINYEYFVFCLSHELVHLTYFTHSERFCNLTAYNILYNSNNEYFVNIALYFANVDLHGGFSEEYSFIGYL